MKILTVKDLKKILEKMDDDRCIFVNLNKFECEECGHEYYGRVKVKDIDTSLPQALILEVSKSRFNDYINQEEEN